MQQVFQGWIVLIDNCWLCRLCRMSLFVGPLGKIGSLQPSPQKSTELYSTSSTPFPSVQELRWLLLSGVPGWSSGLHCVLKLWTHPTSMTSWSWAGPALLVTQRRASLACWISWGGSMTRVAKSRTPCPLLWRPWVFSLISRTALLAISLSAILKGENVSWLKRSTRSWEVEPWQLLLRHLWKDGWALLLRAVVWSSNQEVAQRAWATCDPYYIWWEAEWRLLNLLCGISNSGVERSLGEIYVRGRILHVYRCFFCEWFQDWRVGRCPFGCLRKGFIMVRLRTGWGLLFFNDI